MRFINEIPRKKRKDKCIIIGRGPSVNNLDLYKLNTQQEFDTFCISDAQKLLENPTYVSHYHFASIKRCYGFLHKPKYLLLNNNALAKLKERQAFENWNKDIMDLSNLYVFNSRHVKFHQIKRGEFDKRVTNTLFNSSGSVVGAINFLFGYMGYQEVCHIGFDGGEQKGNAGYGKLCANSRKDTKIAGSVNKYYESWRAVLCMIERHYTNKEFKKLDKFLIQK